MSAALHRRTAHFHHRPFENADPDTGSPGQADHIMMHITLRAPVPDWFFDEPGNLPNGGLRFQADAGKSRAHEDHDPFSERRSGGTAADHGSDEQPSKMCTMRLRLNVGHFSL